MSSENVTSGLRLSGRYTSARNVVISKCSPSLRATDRAEPLALQPYRVGPAARPIASIASGRASVVDVDVRRSSRSSSASRTLPPTRYERCPARGEARRELLGRRTGLEEAREARRHTHHDRPFWRLCGAPAVSVQPAEAGRDGGSRREVQVTRGVDRDGSGPAARRRLRPDRLAERVDVVAATESRSASRS